MNILLDTNVIIDILSKRQPFFKDSYDCLARIFANCDQPFITASCVTDVVYILRKYIADKFALVSCVENLMDLVAALDIKHSTIKKAFSLEMKDFEDAVVLQCAMDNGIDAIITRNKNDFVNSTISIWTPDEYLQHH